MNASTEKCWFILDTRQVVGNCALWWGVDSQGYTCNLAEAGLYTHDFAFSDRRNTDVPVHVDVARAAARTHVRVEPLWDDEETGARLRAARDERIEALERADELSECALHDALACNPFDGDYGPSGMVLLRDEIVRAAKQHACHDCRGNIREGLRHRYRVERSDEGLDTFRWCHACTKLHMGYPYGEQKPAER